MHSILELSATSAIAAMQRGELRAEDYAAALLQQADEQASLNAFRSMDRDAVLEAARAADLARTAGQSLGALHGLPMPVKDSVDTRTLPTSNGTYALRDFTPAADAPVLQRLFTQGAILMGKTNLHELSYGWTSNNQSFGPVRNPYDHDRVPGGSSGGSAVAVAARMAPLAVAEDTLGSIRVPAAMCGIAGLRPSFGRYPNAGTMPQSQDRFDQVGPLARTVEDLALFDSVVTGAAPLLGAVPLRGVRLGVAPAFFHEGLDGEVDHLTRIALERLVAAGVTLVETALPDSAGRAMDVVLTIIGYETIPAFTDFLALQGAGVSLDEMLHYTGEGVLAERNDGQAGLAGFAIDNVGIEGI